MNNDANHTEEDFENIPPREPTLGSFADSMWITELPVLLERYGIPFTEEPGYLTRNPTYHWYDDAPYGIMVHHTATSGYNVKSAYPQPDGNRTDGRTICNILIQPNGLVNLVSADPANYSSGLNWKQLLTEFVSKRLRFHGPQSGPLGPEWYGNRAWVNIEMVHRGDSSAMPPEQEDSLMAVLAIICATQSWDATAVIGHLDGRGTKIDPRWFGRYGTPPYTIADIQDRVQDILDTNNIGDTVQHYRIGDENPAYEEIVWMLGVSQGLDINANANSAQIESVMPWKAGIERAVRIVQEQDFELLATVIDLNQFSLDKIKERGLWPLGKEVAKLRDVLYRTSS